LWPLSFLLITICVWLIVVFYFHQWFVSGKGIRCKGTACMSWCLFDTMSSNVR
jgi:hypothetical protein